MADIGQDRLKCSVVRLLGAAEGRELQPEHKQALERKVPREVVEDEGQGKALQKVEKAENNPVCQPLNVVIVTRALERLEGQVSGQGPANEVGDRGSERVEEVKEGANSDAANEEIALGELQALLGVIHDRIFRQLLVKLSDVVVNIALYLLEYGVLGDLLRGGHDVIFERQELMNCRQ